MSGIFGTVEMWSHGMPDMISMNDGEMTMREFCAMVEYVFCNTDLLRYPYDTPDARMELVRKIKASEYIAGRNGKTSCRIKLGIA